MTTNQLHVPDCQVEWSRNILWGTNILGGDLVYRNLLIWSRNIIWGTNIVWGTDNSIRLREPAATSSGAPDRNISGGRARTSSGAPESSEGSPVLIVVCGDRAR